MADTAAASVANPVGLESSGIVGGSFECQVKLVRFSILVARNPIWSSFSGATFDFTLPRFSVEQLVQAQACCQPLATLSALLLPGCNILLLFERANFLEQRDSFTIDVGWRFLFSLHIRS
jgi:hypothetical protein